MISQTPINRNFTRNISTTKITDHSIEKLADTIIDSFNEQTQLNNLFKLRVKKMIDSIAYTNPDEGIKLKKMIDSFFYESKKLSGDYLKKILDTYLENNYFDNRNHGLMNDINQNEPTSKNNENWMKDWMEQADNYKKSSYAMTLIASNVEDFLHYADILESKIELQKGISV